MPDAMNNAEDFDAFNTHTYPVAEEAEVVAEEENEEEAAAAN